jgi:hypothetical protein
VTRAEFDKFRLGTNLEASNAFAKFERHATEKELKLDHLRKSKNRIGETWRKAGPLSEHRCVAALQLLRMAGPRNVEMIDNSWAGHVPAEIVFFSVLISHIPYLGQCQTVSLLDVRFSLTALGLNVSSAACRRSRWQLTGLALSTALPGCLLGRIGLAFVPREDDSAVHISFGFHKYCACAWRLTCIGEVPC